MEVYLKRCVQLGIIMHAVCAGELYGPYDVYAMINYEIPSLSLPPISEARCVISISVAQYVSKLPSGIRLRHIKKKMTECLIEQEAQQKECNSERCVTREQQICSYENLYEKNPDSCPSILFQNKLHRIALQRVRNTKKSN